MPAADLHLHSTASDGSDAPARVVERAAALGLGTIALTDHDTTAGLAEAAAAAATHDIAFLPGVEISAWYAASEVHVTGLGIDAYHPELQAALTTLTRDRDHRMQSILALLEENGIHLDESALRAKAGHGAIGRMHVALALMDAGVTKIAQEGFDRFLNPGRPAWVPKACIPVEDAVALIHGAGGLAFIAHPGLSKSLRKLTPQLLGLPFDGIEAWHPSHSPGRIAEYKALAYERGLLVAGGSDCHGTVKGKPTMGTVRVQGKYAQRIQEALARA